MMVRYLSLFSLWLGLILSFYTAFLRQSSYFFSFAWAMEGHFYHKRTIYFKKVRLKAHIWPVSISYEAMCLVTLSNKRAVSDNLNSLLTLLAIFRQLSPYLRDQTAVGNQVKSLVKWLSVHCARNYLDEFCWSTTDIFSCRKMIFFLYTQHFCRNCKYVGLHVADCIAGVYTHVAFETWEEPGKKQTIEDVSSFQSWI